MRMGQHGFHTPAGGELPRHWRPQRARQARGRDVGWPMREMGCTLPAASGVSHWSGAAGDCQVVGLLFLVFLFCPQGAGFAGASDQFTLAGGKRCEAGTCPLTLARHVVEVRAACSGEGCKRQRRACGDRHSKPRLRAWCFQGSATDAWRRKRSSRRGCGRVRWRGAAASGMSTKRQLGCRYAQ